MQKILIIDDEPEVRMLMARRLAASRFETLEAGDGAAGFQKAKETKPDLIILDLKMPGEDGLQIYRLMRSEPELQKVPVLFLTAISTGGKMGRESLALIASAKHGFELSGNYEVMGKPYDSKQLLETLRRMLAGP
ncbi:MAG: response regulator [Candidatus Omnitrophota bacterium]|nr:response regulator [Candidatus Omnitrophota bacterium]